MHESVTPVEQFPDPIDRASAEEAMRNGELLAEQRRRAQALAVAPREDGECACGCGEEVDPRRLALGYGLTVKCMEKRERRAKGL